MAILYHLIAALLAGLAFYFFAWLPVALPTWLRVILEVAAALMVWWLLLAFTPLGP